MLHINKILKKLDNQQPNFDTSVLVVPLSLFMYHTVYQQKIESQQKHHHKMFYLRSNVT